jgi:DNA-binding transcriptional regulator YhcF (GntR family)
VIDRDSPVPLHYQLYLELKEWFVREFSPREVLPTELAIAERFGIGRGTVRIALDNLVREGLIVRTSGRGTFLSEDYQVRLRQVRVGIILSEAEFANRDVWEYTWVHHLQMINGIMEASPRYNVATELISEEIFTERYNDLCEGFVLCRYLRPDVLARIRRPVASLNYLMDFLDGFRQVARHVAAAGYSRVGYIGWPTGGRLDTVNRVLAESGRAPIAAEDVVVCDGAPEDGYGACRQLLRDGRPIDGIICSTDLRAIGVLDYLHESGRAVPDAVSVYGFDGILKSELTAPPLTTCGYDWKYPGHFSIREIRALLDGREAPVYVPPGGELIVRKSTRRA